MGSRHWSRAHQHADQPPLASTAGRSAYNQKSRWARMPEVYRRPRIYAFPYHTTLFDARLDTLAEEAGSKSVRSEEHTSELQSHSDLVCRLLLEKKKSTT